MAEAADTETMEQAQGKAGNIASRHPLRMSAAAGMTTLAAIFGSGYLLGKKRAESQSFYDKLMHQFKMMKL